MDKSCEQGEELDETMDKKNPLLMEDHLGLVLQHLDEKNLKSCIFVSKLWYKEARRELIKTEYIRIPSKFHDDLKSKSDKEKAVIYKNAKETLLSWGFSLISNANVAINDVRDIDVFNKLGLVLDSKIKRVKLMSGCSVSVEFIEQILTKCSNLIFIDTKQVVEIKQLNSSGSLPDTNVHFSLMETICAQLDKNQNQNRNQRRASLLTISDFQLDLPCILNSNKLAQYEQFAEKTEVRLNNLSLISDSWLERVTEPEKRVKLIEATTKILYTSKNSTKKLEFAFGAFFPILCNDIKTLLSEMLIPVMPNLHILHLHLHTHFFADVFPADFQFAHKFPNLKTVELKLHAKTFNPRRNYLEQIFASTGPASSVKSLSFSPVYPYSNLQTLFQIFNQVEEFSMWMENGNGTGQDSEMLNVRLKEIFLSGVKLKSLEILNVSVGLPSIVQLSGLSEEDGAKISKWDFSEDEINQMELEQPITPSIVNLQALEQLTIKSLKNCEGNESKVLWLLRKISSEFMPKLKEIKIDLEEESQIPVSKFRILRVF